MSLTVKNEGFDHKTARGCLRQLARLCESFSLDTLTRRVAACQEMLRGSGTIDLPVLGQFKAGKSTFLNFVAGSDLLPVNALPAI